MTRIIRQLQFCALGAATLFIAEAAQADIPAGYTGKPYQGTPSAIPGRVELANVDIGGAEVTYHADHNRMNSAGYEPISGNDYRPDETNLPNICKTNGTNPDSWLADGTLYPSAATPNWYYIGYAHAVDWVKVTVNVAQAGKYNVSSNWASDGPKWGLSIWFDDGHSAVDPKHPKDGVNKSGVVIMDGTSDFHKWKAYPNFTTVDLSAGLQVMTFHLEQFDHLQYGFLQFDLVGAPAGGGGGGAGAGGASGALGASGGASASASGAGGVAGSATAGAAGSIPSGIAGTGGADAAGGSPSAGGAAPTPAGGGSDTMVPSSAGSSSSENSSSCAVGHAPISRWPGALAAFIAACALLRRRKPKSSE